MYELHIRDFSAMDQSVPEQLQGSYLAFAEQSSQVRIPRFGVAELYGMYGSCMRTCHGHHYGCCLEGFSRHAC